MYILKSLVIMTGFTASLLQAASLNKFSDLNFNTVAQELTAYSTQKSADGWFAYSIPAAPETRSMCCWNQGHQAMCDLNSKHNGFGSSSDSPFTEHVNVLVQMSNQKVKKIMPLGDHCSVKANGITVDWLTNVDSQQSIKWLKSQATGNNNQHDNGSLYALSLHVDKQAAEVLFDMAQQQNGEAAEQAIFWLGQRKHDGFPYLKELFDNLPVGELRKKINFALSQNNHPKALSLLKDIALSDQDSEQQVDAIFWLSQTAQKAGLVDFLMKLFNRTDKYVIQEKVIFSLSQINNQEASQELTQLAKTHQNTKVREQALFWLAQNSPTEAALVAMSLLASGNSKQVQENAVFVLSQLPGKQGSEALFNIVKGQYDRSIKKQALFWLSQSDDADTIRQLEQLL